MSLFKQFAFQRCEPGKPNNKTFKVKKPPFASRRNPVLLGLDELSGEQKVFQWLSTLKLGPPLTDELFELFIEKGIDSMPILCQVKGAMLDEIGVKLIPRKLLMAGIRKLTPPPALKAPKIKTTPSGKGTAKSSSSKKGPQSIEGFTVGATVQVHRGTYKGMTGEIIRFSPNGLQTAKISIEGIETPFLKLAFMSLEGEEREPAKKSSSNEVERHGNSPVLTEKQEATLDGWYNANCTSVDTGDEDADKIRQPFVWTSYQNYCEGKGIRPRTTSHASMTQMRDYLIGKGHKYIMRSSGKYWYCNLKLNENYVGIV